MSLVIEALRRVEKADTRPGSIGAFVASYRPVQRARRPALPLLLGLATGGALVFLLSGQAPTSASRGQAPDLVPGTMRPKGAAGLPPPMIVESALRPLKTQPPAEASAPSSPAPPKAENRGEAREGAPRTVLVLQAISERDSHPIAVINDQLVKEGDRVGAARVLHIGSDSVELVLENGQRDTVRFAPPPPPMPDASPTPSPHP